MGYHNIGPFGDQTYIQIAMQEGKYLIQAPIGSGKSFLFFDGPLYGLYKYSQRKMLHARASQGHIIARFTVDGQEYCAYRQLRPGKTKDRCQSRFFLLPENAHKKLNALHRQHDTLILERNLWDWMNDNALLEDEIVFKNESDMQSNLDTLIPPREVFASTMMLTQDAENIFELATNDRLQVFKNIFGLLGVDEAKEIIQEAKKETQTARKVQSDTSRFDERLKTYTHQLRTCYTSLCKNTSVQESVSLHLHDRKDQIQERDMIEGQARIGNASLKGLPRQGRESLHEVVQARYHTQQQKHKRYQEEKNTLQELETKHRELVKKEETQTQQLEKLTAKIDKLRTAIRDADSLHKEIQTQENKLSRLDTHALSLTQSIPTQRYDSWPQEHKQLAQETFSRSLSDIQSFPHLHQWIQECMTVGRRIADKEQLLQDRLKALEQQEEHYQTDYRAWEIKEDIALGSKAIKHARSQYTQKIENIENKRTQLQAQKRQLDTEKQRYIEKKKEYEKQLQQLQERHKQVSHFDCARIQEPCPYITAINKQSIDQLTQQRSHIKQALDKHEQSLNLKEHNIQQDNIQKDIETLTQEITNIRRILTAQEAGVPAPQETVEHAQEEIQNLKNRYKPMEIVQEKKNTQTSYDDIHLALQESRKYIQILGWKEIQQQEKEYENIRSHIKQLRTIQSQQHHITREIQNLQKDQTIVETTLKTLQEQLISSKKTMQTHQDIVNKLQKESDPDMYAKLEKAVQIVQELGTARDRMQELVEEYKQTQTSVHALQEKEKRLQHLYKIFHKELLFVVLDTSLPVLNEIMNAYLSQVVDYRLHMSIQEERGSIHMHAEIIDARGKRDISALSGGQKTILKLVRMLSVASYMRSRMLFLDETINNLDSTTIADVADMLQDFVRKHDCRLYVVTHSAQIQQMSMRDKVLHIPGQEHTADLQEKIDTAT